MDFGSVSILIVSGGAIGAGLVLARRILQAPLPVLSPWQDPRYRFRSLLELQQAARQGFVLDVSTASVDDWLRLPILSIHQARMLVQLQRSGLSFHCVEDLAAALDLPPQQLEPLGSVLRFTYYEANSPLACPKLNPNAADRSALLQLPAMDAPLADQILQNRQSQGRYLNLADFQSRLNLSSDRLADLMHYLTFMN